MLACSGKEIFSRCKAENIFLLASILLAFFYGIAVYPLNPYQHGGERFLHVVDYAMGGLGHPGRMPIGFLELLKRTAPDKLDRYGDQTKRWDKELARNKYFSENIIAHTKYGRSPSLPWNGDKFRQFVQIPLQYNKTVSFVTHYNPASYPIIGYLPFIPPTMIGLLLGLPPLIILYMATATNALLNIVLSYFLIRFTPVMKWLYCFTLLLPSVCLNRVHVMPDALILELCLCLASSVFYLQIHKPLLKGKAQAALIFLSMMIGLVKIAYFLVPALLWLVPTACFPMRRHKIIFVVMALTGSMACATAWNIHILHMHKIAIVANASDAALHYNPDYVLLHPFAVMSDIASATVKNIGKWEDNAIFWHEKSDLHDIDLSFLAISCLVLMTLFPYGDDATFTLSMAQRVFSVALFISVSAIIIIALAIYMRGTAGIGVQGRYFLPLLPFLCLGFYRPRIFTYQYTCVVTPLAIMMAVVVCIAMHYCTLSIL